jgi:dTDP-4-dehydrorhamnose 3,5-epimerase
MQAIDTPLSGLKLVQLKLIGDSRGFFIERFNATAFAAAGLPTEFVQDNHSRSTPNILRGLHAQHTPPQGKLVGCVRGRIWDVAVDIRAHSSTFGQHYGVELSDTNGKLLWVPGGFAHGFCVLGDEPADVFYKVTATYSPATEVGIHYADAALNIPWPIENPQTSERDKALPSFAEYKKNPVF